MIRRVIQFFQHQLNEFSWLLIGILLALHFILSWLGLWLAQEQALIDFGVYPYYYVVTTSFPVILFLTFKLSISNKLPINQIEA